MSSRRYYGKVFHTQGPAAEKLMSSKLLCVQGFMAEFQKWLQFYGKVSGDYELAKGDFLTEPDMLDRINSAT